MLEVVVCVCGFLVSPAVPVVAFWAATACECKLLAVAAVAMQLLTFRLCTQYFE